MSRISVSKRMLQACAVLAAGLLMQPAHAQPFGEDTIVTFGGGTAAFVPYYTVNNGWHTLVNLTNTSSNSLAVKFRLHEARNSRDVLDFNLALSPHDVWTAFISMGPDGRPRLQTTDRSCTIPISVRDSGASASELAYSGTFRDHTGTNNVVNRMSEGYIEILVMGETSGEGRGPGSPGTGPGETLGAAFRGDTAWFAKHVNGEPRDCDIVHNDFRRRAPEWGGNPGDTIPGLDAGPVQTGSGSPLARLGSLRTSGPAVPGTEVGDASVVGYGPIRSPSPLKVNASLVNQDKGVAAGLESLHFIAFGFPLDNGNGGANLVTAQLFPWFLEPTLASGAGLWSTTALASFNFLEQFLVLSSGGGLASQVKNEWTSNPATGANSDWVVTFPTKRFQADEDANNIQAACNQWRNDATGFPSNPPGEAVGEAGGAHPGWDGLTGHIPQILVDDAAEEDPVRLCPELLFPNVFQAGNDGRADLVVQYDIFDREEGEITVVVDGPIVSPAPPPEVTIDNLPYEVNVLKIGRNAEAAPSALNSLIALAIDTSELPSNANTGWLRMSFQTPEQFEAVFYPVTGFIYKERDFGAPDRNFGQAIGHAYGLPLFFID